MPSFFLLESADGVLLESADKLVLEDHVAAFLKNLATLGVGAGLIYYALSTGDRDLVESYFAAKYGI